MWHACSQKDGAYILIREMGMTLNEKAMNKPMKTRVNWAVEAIR